MTKKTIISLICIIHSALGIAQDSIVNCQLPIVNVNLENEIVKRYLDEVDYQFTDQSQITQYHNINWERKDLPNPAVITVPDTEADTMTITIWNDNWITIKGITKGATEIEIYNLLPKQKYNYQITTHHTVITTGQINTYGRIRMIALPSIVNVRDMGGWATTDGKTVKYGRLYRGSDMNGVHPIDNNDLNTFINELNIGAEIDIRGWYNEGAGISVPGFTDTKNTPDGQTPSYLYTSDGGQTPEALTTYMWQRRWKNEFNFIIQNLKAGRNIYFHCVNGANRTGYLAMLLQGLLGLSYSDIIKDYELTTFSNRLEQKQKIDAAIAHIDSLPGNTLQQKFNHYFVKTLRVKQADIDYLRTEMLEDDNTQPQDTNRDGIVDHQDIANITNHKAKEEKPNIADIIKIINILCKRQ